MCNKALQVGLTLLPILSMCAAAEGLNATPAQFQTADVAAYLLAVWRRDSGLIS